MSTTAAQGLRKLRQRDAIDAALSNEQVTRQRVDLLESAIRAHRLRLDHHGDLLEPLSRRFFGRLLWILTGR